MDVPCSDDADLILAASPGKLGFSLEFDDDDGALITAVHPNCALKDKINAGDRLVTIDGKSVKDDDLSIGNNKQRVLGIATKKNTTENEKHAASIAVENTLLGTNTSNSEGRADDDVASTLKEPPSSTGKLEDKWEANFNDSRTLHTS
mmetsp:Transcript_31728/g.60575  ORF Transcript_31728/g.60575 Transcript_31728/m.60575 type:complete len:148 (+) Transcript_31728:192-635(+)